MFGIQTDHDTIFNRGKGMGILAELVDKYLPNYVQEEVAREIERAGF